jgi:hypothetical protein
MEQLNTSVQEPSLEYLSELSFHHARESVNWHSTVFESLHRLKNFQTLNVGGGIFTVLFLEIQFKHTFYSSIL